MGQKTGRRRRVAGMLFVAKGDDPHARGLRQARQIGDGNTWQAEDRVDAIELQGLNDQVKTINGLGCAALGGLAFLAHQKVSSKGFRALLTP